MGVAHARRERRGNGLLHPLQVHVDGQSCLRLPTVRVQTPLETLSLEFKGRAGFTEWQNAASAALVGLERLEWLERCNGSEDSVEADCI